jgi:hypothetical protein
MHLGQVQNNGNAFAASAAVTLSLGVAQLKQADTVMQPSWLVANACALLLLLLPMHCCELSAGLLRPPDSSSCVAPHPG